MQQNEQTYVPPILPQLSPIGRLFQGFVVFILLLWIGFYGWVVVSVFVPALQQLSVWHIVMDWKLGPGLVSMAAIAIRLFVAGWWNRSASVKSFRYGGTGLPGYLRFLKWQTSQGKWWLDATVSLSTATISVFLMYWISYAIQVQWYLPAFPNAVDAAVTSLLSGQQILLSLIPFMAFSWFSMARPYLEDLDGLPEDMLTEQYAEDWLSRLFNRIPEVTMEKLTQPLVQWSFASFNIILTAAGVFWLWKGLGSQPPLPWYEGLALGFIQSFQPAFNGYSAGFLAAVLQYRRQKHRWPWTKYQDIYGQEVSDWSEFARNALENGVVVWVVDALAGIFATALQYVLMSIGMPKGETQLVFFLMRETIAATIGLLYVNRRLIKLGLSKVDR